MRATDFLKYLQREGFDFFSGVPCSYLKPLCELLEDMPFNKHVPAVREDLALGIAAGAALSRKNPVVYMQNSGLGYSMEALASLHIIYRLPVLLLVTYRGPDDTGWEEHQVFGRKTEPLLQTFEIKHSIFSGEFTAGQFDEIQECMRIDQQPYALLIPRGALT